MAARRNLNEYLHLTMYELHFGGFMGLTLNCPPRRQMHDALQGALSNCLAAFRPAASSSFCIIVNHRRRMHMSWKRNMPKIAFKRNFFVNIFGVLSLLFYDAFVLRPPAYMQTTHSTGILPLLLPASCSARRHIWSKNIISVHFLLYA